MRVHSRSDVAGVPRALLVALFMAPTIVPFIVSGLSAQVRPAVPDLGWVAIPAGSFEMGCAPRDEQCAEEELPRHRVTISRPFELMAAEVTVGQFRAYTSATGTEPPQPPRFAQTDDHPVVNVSWEDGDAFCRWAGGSLPTEAAWEYAARGGHNERIYPWGNEPSHRLANYGAEECCAGLAFGPDRWENTAPVRSFPANGYGLFDMGGNVWEWVADWFGPYEAGGATDPAGPPGGETRMARGGSWLNFPAALRASNRLPFSGAVSNVGFRCLRSTGGAPPEKKTARGVDQRHMREGLATVAQESLVAVHVVARWRLMSTVFPRIIRSVRCSWPIGQRVSPNGPTTCSSSTASAVPRTLNSWIWAVRDSCSFLPSGRRDYDEASNDTNADAFTADKRPVGA